MLLILFEICMGICGLDIILFFVDDRRIDFIFFLITVIPTAIDGWIRTYMFEKRRLRCKDCGASFSLEGHKLFNQLAPWKMPVRIQHGKEIEPRLYGRAWIKCSECGSYECVLLQDE